MITLTSNIGETVDVYVGATVVDSVGLALNLLDATGLTAMRVVREVDGLLTVEYSDSGDIVSDYVWSDEVTVVHNASVDENGIVR